MLFSKKYPIAVVTIICLSCLKFSIPSPVPEKYVSCSDVQELRHPDCEHTFTRDKYYFQCEHHYDNCEDCDCGRHTEEEKDGKVSLMYNIETYTSFF